MRNRIYITSITDKSETQCIEFSNKNRNVIIFAPNLKSIYFNGKRYGSVNSLKADEVNTNLFKMNIDWKLYALKITQGTENDAVYMKFQNKKYQLLKNKPISITMTAGERAQMFFSKNLNFMNNNVYFWISNKPDNVCVDKNNVITAINPVGECLIELKNIYGGNDDALYTISINVVDRSNYIDKIYVKMGNDYAVENYIVSRKRENTDPRKWITTIDRMSVRDAWNDNARAEEQVVVQGMIH